MQIPDVMYALYPQGRSLPHHKVDNSTDPKIIALCNEDFSVLNDITDQEIGDLNDHFKESMGYLRKRCENQLEFQEDMHHFPWIIGVKIPT